MAFTLLKRLLTSITQSDAYRLGLVNSSGKILKFPTTDKEKNSLTVLDQVVFKLKCLLGTKLTVLNRLLYLVSISDNYLNKLSGGDYSRTEIEKMRKELNDLPESSELFDLWKNVLNESGVVLSINKVKFKETYLYKNYDFDFMNKALFEDMRKKVSKRNNRKDKYLNMTNEELEESGFYLKYAHLK